jgi:hypothetical protein
MSAATLGTLVIALVLAVAIGVLISFTLRAWRRRGERQAAIVGELHPLPDTVGPAVIRAASGLYVGSTLAPGGQDKIGSGDLGYPTKAVLNRYPQGIMLVRTGARAIWIPQSSVIAIRLEAPEDGSAAQEILAITWRLPSGVQIDSGFCGDDSRMYQAWIDYQDRVDRHDRKDTA